MIANVFSKAEHKTQSEAAQRILKRHKRGMICVFESLAEQTIVLVVFTKTQPIQAHLTNCCMFGCAAKKYSFECPLKSTGKIIVCTVVFSKGQLSKTSNLLCVRRPIPAKCSIYCLLKLWRKDKCGTIVFSKAQTSESLHVLCVSNAQPNKVCTLVVDFPCSTE